MRVTFDGCDFERATVEGDLSVWRVHVPIDQQPIRIDTDKLIELSPGSDVMLTFKRDALDSALPL